MSDTASTDSTAAVPPTTTWRMLGRVLGTAVVAWVADFLAKEWVIASMAEGEQRQVLGELLQWHFVRNPGAAFSLASGSTKRRQKSFTTYDAPQLRCVQMVDMYAAASDAMTMPSSPAGRKVSIAG